jgi:hypothetical protein
LTTLPATLTPNTSPSPWSKAISIGARESMHPRIAANGYCPDAVAATLADQSRGFIALATKRRFPSWRRSIAAAGVIAACDWLVWTSGGFLTGVV